MFDFWTEWHLYLYFYRVSEELQDAQRALTESTNTDVIYRYEPALDNF